MEFANFYFIFSFFFSSLFPRSSTPVTFLILLAFPYCSASFSEIASYFIIPLPILMFSLSIISFPQLPASSIFLQPAGAVGLLWPLMVAMCFNSSLDLRKIVIIDPRIIGLINDGA